MFYCISYPKRERKTFNGNIPDYLQKGAELLPLSDKIGNGLIPLKRYSEIAPDSSTDQSQILLIHRLFETVRVTRR